MNKYIDLLSLGTKLQIITAFSVDHVKDFIYIEADKQCDINEVSSLSISLSLSHTHTNTHTHTLPFSVTGEIADLILLLPMLLIVF